jgi:hypothetical protein
VSALTFDMRGAQKAQPFGHPLDGRVRRHFAGPDAAGFICGFDHGWYGVP